MFEIVLLVILILLSAFFSLSETALTTVSQPRIVHMIEEKKRGARTLRRLRENPAKLISTILVGNNIVNISALVLATTVIEEYLRSIGLGAQGTIIAIAIGLMTMFILIFGEITPKTLAIRKAEAISLFVAPILSVIEMLLGPLVAVMTWLSRPIIFLLGGHSQEKIPFITEEVIKTLLIAGEKEGAIEKDEREMISSVFKFTDLTSGAVMTQRDKIIYVEAGATINEAIAKIRESGHSRLPVIDQTLDNIVGVIYAKDLLRVNPADFAGNHLRQALFIPTSKKLNDVLDQMQVEYHHLAIVVDEFGHTLGLVTMEDVIEEIVGEIHDEYERLK